MEIYRHQVQELREEMQDSNNEFSKIRDEYFVRMNGGGSNSLSDVDGGDLEESEERFEMPFMTTEGGGSGSTMKNETIGL